MNPFGTGQKNQSRADLPGVVLIHETGSVRNRFEIGMDKPYIYMRPGRMAPDRFSYPLPNGFTYKSDPVWNFTFPG